MIEIQDKKKSDEGSTSKKQKWIKKWEPHTHCAVCGVAVDIGIDYCSSKCSGEYQEWKTKQEKKNKRNNIMTFVLMIGMVALIVFMTMFGFGG